MFYMTEEMSFKYLLDAFWTVSNQKFKISQSKVYDGAFFAKIINKF